MTPGDCVALAAQDCCYCFGLGIVTGRGPAGEHPCKCVYRAIFRECLARFREFAALEGRLSQVRYDNSSPRSAGKSWGIPRLEFVADFCLIAQRVLTPAQHRVFKYYFLLGADGKLCCRRLAMKPGVFFHMVYRIEELLGKALRSVEPYRLHPVEEYLAGTQGRRAESPRAVRVQARRTPVSPPLRAVRVLAGNAG